MVGLDNNFLGPFEDMEGSDYRNWPTQVIRGSGSHLYYARLTQAPPGTPVTPKLETGVGLKLENLQGTSTVDTSGIFSPTKKEFMLIFHKGVIEMARGKGVPKIAAGQFAKVKHATATSPHLYGVRPRRRGDTHAGLGTEFLGWRPCRTRDGRPGRQRHSCNRRQGCRDAFWSAARSNRSQNRPITCTCTCRRIRRGRRAPAT